MARRRDSSPEPPKPVRGMPAATPEGVENRLISLATELAEKQLREGTASSQVISQLLKLGSSRERLEQQRIKHENDLMQVKKEAIEAQARTEELYKQALNAMRSYSGQDPIDFDNNFEVDYDD